MEIKEIYIKLTELLKKSYSPYSKFKVACIVVDENGNHYYGVNVENISFGATICAERSAITNMITNGGKEIKELYVMTSSEKFVPPCGICLQFISEFMSPKSSVFLFDCNKRYKHWLLENLLPTSFSRENNKEDINE